MKIGTLTTGVGVVTTINLNYVPQYLIYTAATQLTGLRVTVEGDGTIIDLDATGLNSVSGIRRFGNVTNTYMIPLADGFLPDKVTELIFTNSAAQTPIIYGSSLSKGSGFIRTVQSLVLANSQIAITDFAYIGVKAGTANDIINIEFQDGHVQRFDINELKEFVTLYSNEVDADVIDNIEGNIKVVTYNPDTNRTLYITKFFPMGRLL